MEGAVWEFLWCVSKTTKEIAKDGHTVGLVLGGKVINSKMIAKELHTKERKVRRNLNKLEDQGYIQRVRYMYGYRVLVMKSKRSLRNKISGKALNALMEEITNKWSIK